LYKNSGYNYKIEVRYLKVMSSSSLWKLYPQFLVSGKTIS